MAGIAVLGVVFAGQVAVLAWCSLWVGLQREDGAGEGNRTLVKITKYLEKESANHDS
jgi:hypothetical protein